MKIVLVATTAAMLALSTPAHADPDYHYTGGCYLSAVSDGTDSPGTEWTGQVSALVVATTSANPATPVVVSISFECHMYIDGVFYDIINRGAGTGSATHTDRRTFWADPDSVVTLCDKVNVGGEPHTQCGDATVSGILPQPVEDAINAIRDTLEDEVVSQIDPTVCPMLGEMAPGIPGIVDITPEGDVYVDSGRISKDCPPYAPRHGDPGRGYLTMTSMPRLPLGRHL